MKGRAYSSFYWAFWGTPIGFSLSYVFFGARGNINVYLIISVCAAISGAGLGYTFTSLFMPGSTKKKHAYGRGALGGLIIGALAWPLVGFLQGFIINVLALLNGYATLWESIVDIFRFFLLSITSALFTLTLPLGWLYLGLMILLGCLLTFRFRKIYNID